MSKEPLVHISKREEMPLAKAVMVRLVAVLLSLIVYIHIAASNNSARLRNF